MKTYEITGKLTTNGKKATIKEEALDKQEVWLTPQAFGFTKIFSVKEAQGIQRFNKRDFIEEK
jgi:hypothetical protein